MSSQFCEDISYYCAKLINDATKPITTPATIRITSAQMIILPSKESAGFLKPPVNPSR